MGGKGQDPTAFLTGKTRYRLHRRLGGHQERSALGAGNLAATGIRSPDRRARSQSLYRLRYPGPHMDDCSELVWKCMGEERGVFRGAFGGKPSWILSDVQYRKMDEVFTMKDGKVRLEKASAQMFTTTSQYRSANRRKYETTRIASKIVLSLELVSVFSLVCRKFSRWNTLF